VGGMAAAGQFGTIEVDYASGPGPRAAILTARRQVGSGDIDADVLYHLEDTYLRPVRHAFSAQPVEDRAPRPVLLPFVVR
jgi:hypothetical protein